MSVVTTKYAQFEIQIYSDPFVPSIIFIRSIRGGYFAVWEYCLFSSATEGKANKQRDKSFVNFTSIKMKLNIVLLNSKENFDLCMSLSGKYL